MRKTINLFSFTYLFLTSSPEEPSLIESLLLREFLIVKIDTGKIFIFYVYFKLTKQLIGRKDIPIKTIDYGYDGNGNQVLKYLTFTPTTPPPLRGRMKEGGKEFITSFAYDPENRLTGITYSTPHIFKKRTRTNNFAYCAFGKRIYKSDSLGDTYYFYDGDNILLELDSQNRTLARYTTGLGIDEWISKTIYTPTYLLPPGGGGWRRGGKSKTIYYHYDGLGSVVALTNERGNVIKKYNYSPFGTLVSQGIASPYLAPTRERLHKHFPPSRRNTITYTGREYDPDSGLYFYRARYYDSRVGRFLQKDLMRSINPYVYVGNNPINRIDPTGLITYQEEWKKIESAYFVAYWGLYSIGRRCGLRGKDEGHCTTWAQRVYTEIKKLGLQCWDVNIVTCTTAREIGSTVFSHTTALVTKKGEVGNWRSKAKMLDPWYTCMVGILPIGQPSYGIYSARRWLIKFFYLTKCDF